jgi:hypothetical protein
MSEDTVDRERLALSVLQERLKDQYRAFRDDPTMPYTAVVVPSQTVDPVELAKIEGVAHYEERSLFNLMLLRHPRLKVVFVTSKRLNPLIVDYYIHQMRAVPPSHAYRRLVLLDCDDASARPLVQKVLERPRLVERIRAEIDDPERAHLAVFNSTDYERRLAVRLGIPLNAADPDLIHLGSKSGSRRTFRSVGLSLPAGREDLRDTGDLAEALHGLRTEHPDVRRWVVKLDESFSGEGNAVLEVSNLETGLAATRDALPTLRMAAPGLTWDAYQSQFDAMGGIVEAWIEGERLTSPSAQLRINPIGEVQPISTHDQVLGGPEGQVFEGATFPADAGYRLDVQRAGEQVGEALSQAGVIGRFAVDFMARGREDGGWDLFALEINLRQGATTHPFNTLKFITDGHYDTETGEFRTPQGETRSYFCTDYLADPGYRGILPFDLLDQMVVHRTHFQADQTGVVFHLLGCLSRFGKLGCTAIGRDVADARARYRRAVELLDALKVD